MPIARRTWVAACLLALAGPAAAVEVPAQAVSEQTVMVAWIDLETLTPGAVEQSIDHIFSLWPAETADVQPALRRQMAKPIDEFTAYHAALMAAGVRGALLGWDVPAEPEGEADAFVLLHVQPGTTPAQVNQVLAERAPGMKNPELEPFDHQWLAVIEPNMPAPAGDAAERAATFSDLLAEVDDAAVRAVVHQTPELLARGRRQPVRDFHTGLRRGTVAVRVGEALSLELTLDYEDAQDARQGTEDLLLGLVAGVHQLPAMLGTDAQLGDEDAQAMWGAIEPQMAEGTFRLTVGRAFFEALGRVVPQFVEPDVPSKDE